MSKLLSRRKLITAGLATTAGASGLAVAARLADRYGLIPPDHGGIYGVGDALTYIKIEFFVIRVGEWGGHMLLECDDPLTIHKFCSMLPSFVFQVHPVIRVEDAVRGELEVIAWRDGLKGK